MIFLRAVNVGGRTLRVKALADELGFANVGAAGTFVAPAGGKPRALASAILAKSPFPIELMICPGAEILSLLRSDPFPKREAVGGDKRYVTILEKEPPSSPPFPIDRPESKNGSQGNAWEVRVFGITGRYVLSLWRRQGERLKFYANPVVEKAFGLAATTRGWETLETVGKLLESA